MLSTRVPDLAVLDVLMTVARLGSMSAAGREHGLSQQAVSARVRTAETDIGIAVFDRTPRGVVPTAAGVAVLEWVDEVLVAAEKLASGVRSLHSDGHENLTIAASMTVAEYLVPRWIVRMRTLSPTVRVRLRPTNSADVIALIADGSADIGFVEGPVDTTDLDTHDVASDELLVVVAREHPWATRSSITAAELQTTPLIAREPGSGTRTTLERAVPDMVEPLLELTSVTAIKAAVLSANTPAVLSSLSVGMDIADGRLVAVPVDGLSMPRTLRAVWNDKMPLQGPRADFVKVALGVR